jgi:hypothetical protein
MMSSLDAFLDENLTQGYLDKLVDFPSKPSSNREIEVRLRKVPSPHQISRGDFYNLKEKLSAEGIHERIEITEEESWNNLEDINITHRRIKSPGENSFNRQIQKTRHKKLEILSKELGIKIAVSTEENEENVTDTKAPKEIRKKTRSIFSLPQAEIHLTEVISSSTNRKYQDPVQTYEVEIELTTPLLPLLSFKALIKRMWQLIHTSPVGFNNLEARDLVSFFSTQVPWTTMSSVRGLVHDDLEIGGIVEGKVDYFVSPKADGETRMLICSKGEVWYYLPPTGKTSIVITRPGITIGNIEDEFILEGELVRLKDGLKEVFLAYDCLYYKDTSKREKYWLMKENYQIRRRHAYRAISLMKQSNIHLKDAILFKDRDGFFESCSQFLTEIQDKKFPYHTDGLVFTPNGPYLTEGSYPENFAKINWSPELFASKEFLEGSPKYQKNRKLTELTDICKWKPISSLTIDFLVRDEKVSYKLMVGTTTGYSKQRTEKLFEILIPPWTFFQRDNVDFDSLRRIGVKDGDIVEFRYDRETNKMIPIAFRHDRTTPNSWYSADSVWNSIHHSISMDLLMGKSNDMMSRYHNSIKLSLFQMAYDLKTGQKSRLLDLGSGVGGDVKKWLKYSEDKSKPKLKFDNIFAVEPKTEFHNELKSRLNVLGNEKENVTLIKCGAEETDKIISGLGVERVVKGGVVKEKQVKVDVISLMLSMSFFEENDTKYKGFITTILNTLKEKGHIIFLTIDGDSVDKYFNYQPGKATFSGTTIEYFGYRKGSVYIPVKKTGTVEAEGQKEWPPHLSRFLVNLEKFFPIKAIFQSCYTRKLFSKGEEALTRLFTCGIISRNKEDWERLPSIFSNATKGLFMSEYSYDNSVSDSDNASQVSSDDVRDSSYDSGDDYPDEDVLPVSREIVRKPLSRSRIEFSRVIREPFELTVVDGMICINQGELLDTGELGCKPRKNVVRLATLPITNSQDDTSLQSVPNLYHAVIQGLYPSYRKLSLIHREELASELKKKIISSVKQDLYSKIEKNTTVSWTKWFGNFLVEKEDGNWYQENVSEPFQAHHNSEELVKILEDQTQLRIEHLLPILINQFNVGTIVLGNPGTKRYAFGIGRKRFIAVYVYHHHHPPRYETIAEYVAEQVKTPLYAPSKELEERLAAQNIVQHLTESSTPDDRIHRFQES